MNAALPKGRCENRSPEQEGITTHRKALDECLPLRENRSPEQEGITTPQRVDDLRIDAREPQP